MPRQIHYLDPKRLPKEVCHHCRRFVNPVRVAGHLQCPSCTQVIEPCCQGMSQAQAAESQVKK